MIIIRSSNFSAVRSTDFVSVPTDPSDKSLGYFQSSAKRGLSGTDFLGKAMPGSKFHLASFTLRQTLSTLSKYPGEVLSFTEEDNQPQNCHHGRRCCSTMIQE